MPSAKAKVSADESAEEKQDGKYFKLWRRFYEPLVLLKILGSTRGKHSPALREHKRYRFLENLAYICDRDKGGHTTSAVGLEEAFDGFKFWIACNSPKETAKGIPFLKATLRAARDIADLPTDEKSTPERELIQKCSEYARLRIKKEATMLMRDIDKCMSFLTSPRDANLSVWLERFREKEFLEICYLAYHGRHTRLMKELSARIQRHDDLSNRDKQSETISDLIHRLGRLAHHIRAPKEIIEDISDCQHLRNVVDEFEVHSVKPQPIIVRPEADPNIKMSHIINRMLPNRAASRSRYEEAGAIMNQKFNIEDRFKEHFNDKNFKPVMHAEIQVLEHFWTEKLRFFDDDRYIGCSKPACYCCHLYIQHHPAKCVVPQTSRKVYLNWGLRALPEGSLDLDYTLQRDMLNKMVEWIRNDALAQIEKKTSAAPSHPDSQTGITGHAWSVFNEAHEPDRDKPLAETLARLDLGAGVSGMVENANDIQWADADNYASDSSHLLASSSDASIQGSHDVSGVDYEDSDSSDGGASL
ncbi:hypothetical protein F5Y19DRAFT_266702 [Xylariaceae sp. FL1651]|nr:hypothetical protein F5Y19DRAFT_266702 [Xylariaceae sp. FL1651]